MTVRVDRTRIRNRIHGFLATQGIRCAADAAFSERSSPTLQTGDGRPLAAALRARLVREWTHLQALEARRAALRAERAATRSATAAIASRGGAAALCQLRGVAESECGALQRGIVRDADLCRMAGSSARSPAWCRCPIAATSASPDQGISKAGRGELRRISIQLAWCWLRWQPDSALGRSGSRQRFAAAGGRSRRIGIVAVARKLVIALWRFVDHGVMPDGARLKAAR